MRITGITIRDFVPFNDAAIFELKAEFSSDVQVIIGRNGSGKSSLLSQLSLIPQSRSLYKKEGFRSLSVEKDGITYRLDSEYAKPSSPHAFFEENNPENLNPSRTTEIQKDLVFEKLGITPLIDDLIMNRFTFPKWGSAKRKEFIMAHNPDKIGFVLTQIKQTTSKIKACKANLSRLQSRKILLEQDLLSPETVQSMEEERVTLHQLLEIIQQNLMDSEVALRSVGSVQIPAYDQKHVRKTLRQCRYDLHGLQDVPREVQQRQELKEQLQAQIMSATRDLESLLSQIETAQTSLTDMEQRYHDLAPDGSLHEIDATIRQLEQERDNTQILQPTFTLSSEELDQRYREWHDLHDRLTVFQDRTVPLYSSKKRQHREQMLQTAQYRQNSYRMRMSDLEAQYDDLSKRHSITPRDIPDSPCAKDKCPLYTHFMGDYLSHEQKRTDVQSRLEKGRRKLARLDIYVHRLTAYFQESKLYHDQIRWLVDQAQSHPILHHVLRSIDILSTLEMQPYLIAKKVKDAYDQIAQWNRHKTILQDLETAYALKRRHMGSESEETVKLVLSIESTQNTLYGLRNAITTRSHQKAVDQKALQDIQRYETILHTVQALDQQHRQMLDQMARFHDRHIVHHFKSGLETLRAQSFVRLSEIERPLRDQSLLQVRYDEEVVCEINRIEQELSDLQQIEAALIAIPKESVISFMNDVFDQANLLIATIWTIPLEIVPLSMDDILTYDVYVSGDNQSIREISECSEGQTEILTLAINLALRIYLGHLHFPLCLDEAGRTFDEKHKQNLLFLLNRLLGDQIISQLFLVNHHATISAGFANSQTLVIRSDNILLPEKYNEHVTIR